jgi:hypothetical protein
MNAIVVHEIVLDKPDNGLLLLNNIASDTG